MKSQVPLKLREEAKNRIGLDSKRTKFHPQPCQYVSILPLTWQNIKHLFCRFTVRKKKMGKGTILPAEALHKFTK
jgi:hypothetical protein